MKSYGWTTKVAEFQKSIDDKSPKNRQELKRIIYSFDSARVYTPDSMKKIATNLKKEQDPEFVRIVLSYLHEQFFKDGWGMVNNDHELEMRTTLDRKNNLVTVLKQLKELFKEYKFAANAGMYKSVTERINYLLKKLDVKVKTGEQFKSEKTSKLKIASEKIATGEKMPRKLKKNVKVMMVEQALTRGK